MSSARLLLTLAATGLLWGQNVRPCGCGAESNGPPANRESRPYAQAPEDLRPFSKFTTPYYQNYTKIVEYNGAAREAVTLNPADVDTVRIGFLGPIENHRDQALGNMMLNGS